MGKEQLKAEGTISELTWAFRVKLRPEVQVWPDNRKTQDLEWDPMTDPLQRGSGFLELPQLVCSRARAGAQAFCP